MEPRRLGGGVLTGVSAVGATVSGIVLANASHQTLLYVWIALGIFGLIGLMLALWPSQPAMQVTDRGRDTATVGGPGVVVQGTGHHVTVVHDEATSRGPTLDAIVAAKRRNSLDAALKASQPRRDTDLREGLCWIVFGKWGLTPAEDGGGFLDTLTDAVHQMRQAAFDGHVRLWGKSFMTGLYELIEPGFWVNHDIDFTRLLCSSQEVESTTTALTLMAPHGHYIDLQISRVEFENEWPSAGKTYPATL